ncbi:hypothetical protein B0H10DRAFT_2092942, partial [Mycena sp. CBHHK59/15]
PPSLLLPFSSFISASPFPITIPTPSNAAANLVSHPNSSSLQSSEGSERPEPADGMKAKPHLHRAKTSRKLSHQAKSRRELKAASIITSTGFLNSPRSRVQRGWTLEDRRRGLTAYSGTRIQRDRDSEDESITLDSVTLNTLGGTNAVGVSVTYAASTFTFFSSETIFPSPAIEYRRDDWEQPVSGIAEARNWLRDLLNPTLNPSRSPELDGSDKQNQTRLSELPSYVQIHRDMFLGVDKK